MLDLKHRIIHYWPGGRSTITRVSSVSISKDLKDLPNSKATIEIPISQAGENSYVSKGDIYEDSQPVFRRGEEISIGLGYQQHTIPSDFYGVIDEVHLKERDNVIVLELEDATSLLKFHTPKEFVLKDKNVLDIAREGIKGNKYDITIAENSTLDKFKFSEYTHKGWKNSLEFISDLLHDTGLVATFDPWNRELKLQLSTLEPFGTTAFDFYKNIEKSSLKWAHERTNKTVVEVHSTVKKKDPKTKKVETEEQLISRWSLSKDGKPEDVGIKSDATAAKLINFNIPGIDKKTADLIAENAVYRYTAFGFSGSFTSWLIPYVDMNYHVDLYDGEYRSKYHIYRVETRFNSIVGGQRKIFLGRRITQE